MTRASFEGSNYLVYGICFDVSRSVSARPTHLGYCNTLFRGEQLDGLGLVLFQQFGEAVRMRIERDIGALLERGVFFAGLASSSEEINLRAGGLL